MPRKAAPRSSAPIRSSSPSAPARSAAPVPVSNRAMATPHQTSPAATPIGARPAMATGAPAAAPSQGPGLMGQMAATAGGVAIGSAMGHYLTDKLMGGGDNKSEVTQAPASAAQYNSGQPLSQPCEFEWKQFVECSQNQKDVSLCQGFNDIFRQCQMRLAPQ